MIFGTVIFWHITWTRPHYYINVCGRYKIKIEENIADIEETKGTIVSFFTTHFLYIAIATLELF